MRAGLSILSVFFLTFPSFGSDCLALVLSLARNPRDTQLLDIIADAIGDEKFNYGHEGVQVSQTHKEALFRILIRLDELMLRPTGNAAEIAALRAERNRLLGTPSLATAAADDRIARDWSIVIPSDLLGNGMNPFDSWSADRKPVVSEVQVGGQRYTIATDGLFVKLPPGIARIPIEWSRPEDGEEEHAIPDGVWMMNVPVTQLQWALLMKANPSHHRMNPLFKIERGISPSRPVDSVVIEDIKAYLSKLNAMEKSDWNARKQAWKESKDPNKPKRFAEKYYAYRLPTQPELEYAMRGGASGDYCFLDRPRQESDDVTLSLHAWFGEGEKGYTRRVGALRPNAWGIFDGHGHVREWTGSRTAPDSSRSMHYVQGGFYGSPGYTCTNSFKSGTPQDLRFPGHGFRLVREERP